MPTAEATTQTATVPDADIQAALDRAMKFAHGTAKGMAREAAIDGAVDGVTWSVKHWRHDQGPFEHFINRNVKRFVARALVKFRESERRRPEHVALADHDLTARTLPTAGEVPLSPEVRDLPEELRDVVRFYMVDQFTMQECGLLLGLSAATVRTRLIEAAVELNPGFAPRPRAAGAKRLASGGRGR